ncbi:GNAT family N-acetyltransferase [Streptomyces jumonjinensis]|uniref:Lysine N-acyltransferase MbtK n=1 Tax=Streptomyces jumonjinensis TaxID=1945 RepID=A0A646KK95_STRJU|nr:GNAT family N-acetyltransferase [Streptomyces jumonjinensis]MQT02437.1 acetyltransferase [Streptomyces jumonjinensis]
MPPTDASAGAGPADRLTGSTDTPRDEAVGGTEAAGSAEGTEDTLELGLPDDLLTLFREPDRPDHPPAPDALARGQLLDDLAAWGPTSTTEGSFRLVPTRIDRDLALISHWMNDPAVTPFWKLGGPASVTAAHLRAQADGDGRSIPCLGVLGSVPMSYFEIYRADLDPLARHYPARPHDTGVHVLIGTVADRGRGIGSTLLRAVADLVLDNRPRCSRVIAEPDLRNTPSVSAFLSGGFRFSSEAELPGKRAALMIRDRALRNVL